MSVQLITPNPEESRTIQPPAEAPDPQGVGEGRKRHRGSPEVPGPSPHPVSLEEGPGTGRRDLPAGDPTPPRSLPSEAGEGEPETQGGPGPSGPGAHAFKKRDELGLSGRPKGAHYSPEQRQRIIHAVSSPPRRRVCPSERSYDPWGSAAPPTMGGAKDRASGKIPSVLRLTDSERQAILEKKTNRARR